LAGSVSMDGFLAQLPHTNMRL